MGLAHTADGHDARSDRRPPSLASDFAQALVEGLTREQKSIPCRFFYDARGSRLFAEITKQPEYYLARTETAILRSSAKEIAQGTPSGAVLIEFGSGFSLKTEILLDALRDLRAYVPIDISGDALAKARARLKRRFPKIPVNPVIADFAQPVRLAPWLSAGARLGFFPGSTIGNLEPSAAVELLQTMRGTLATDGRLIIGADLEKEEKALLAAYDDKAGATAAFNRNVLVHANRVLGTSFDPQGFEHAATYDEDRRRIDMYLVSTRAQRVRVLGHDFRFKKGERIHTEHSHKYSIASFQDLARKAGWSPLKVWTDTKNLFSVHELCSQQQGRLKGCPPVSQHLGNSGIPATD